MKLPGEALLEFRIEPGADGAAAAKLLQIARFKPKGLMGLMCWYAVRPLHALAFRALLDGIRNAAERLFSETTAGTAGVPPGRRVDMTSTLQS